MMLLATIVAMAAQQTSTINCYDYGYSVQCNATTTPPPSSVNWGALLRQQQQQSQQQMEQAGRNLGAAIAADRERRKFKRAQKAIEAALARDNVLAPPQPTNEQPTQLVCTLEDGSPAVLTLFERNRRVDVETKGTTKAREATFTTSTVTWDGSVWRMTLSRYDGSVQGIALLKELEGATLRGSCQEAGERKF